METPLFDFVVDKRVVAKYTIQNPKDGYIPNTAPTTVVNFQNAAWDLSQEQYDYLRWGVRAIDVAESRSLVDAAIAAEAFLQVIIELPQFAAVLQETEQARERVVAEWENNRSRTAAEIADLLGFEVLGNWKVFITPPSLRSGMNTGRGILWTYRLDWPNYNTVYLWHEVLHSLFGTSHMEHAVIELIADHELRRRLNGDEYPPWHGHIHLDKERRRLLPAWHQHLSRSFTRNIRDFMSHNMAASS
jgi:hypothetical protein